MSKKRETRNIVALILIIILIMLLLCRDKIVQTINQTIHPKSSEVLQGEGSLLVAGQGHALYYVFHAESGEKVDFTRTGSEMPLPAGKYKVTLQGVEKEVLIHRDEQYKLACGTLLVNGIGKDLYEVYDKDGQVKLNFTSTGQALEFFPGSYIVQLHGISQNVTVFSGDTSVTNTGRLLVSGNASDLYYVFDQNGQDKLDFTRVDNEMELLPGSYVVKVQERHMTAEVKPDEITELVFNN